MSECGSLSGLLDDVSLCGLLCGVSQGGPLLEVTVCVSLRGLSLWVSQCPLCVGLSVRGPSWLVLFQQERDLLLLVSCFSISIPVYLWHYY